MSCIEIFWDDLTAQKQNEILEALGENGNYDVIPIATTGGGVPRLLLTPPTL